MVVMQIFAPNRSLCRGSQDARCEGVWEYVQRLEKVYGMRAYQTGHIEWRVKLHYIFVLLSSFPWLNFILYNVPPIAPLDLRRKAEEQHVSITPRTSFRCLRSSFRPHRRSSMGNRHSAVGYRCSAMGYRHCDTLCYSILCVATVGPLTSGCGTTNIDSPITTGFRSAPSLDGAFKGVFP